MAGNPLSPRSWVVFLAAEFILAGLLVMLGAFNGPALVLAGFALFAALWLYENRSPQLNLVLGEMARKLGLAKLDLVRSAIRQGCR